MAFLVKQAPFWLIVTKSSCCRACLALEHHALECICVWWTREPIKQPAFSYAVIDSVDFDWQSPLFDASIPSVNSSAALTTWPMPLAPTGNASPAKRPPKWSTSKRACACRDLTVITNKNESTESSRVITKKQCKFWTRRREWPTWNGKWKSGYLAKVKKARKKKKKRC